MSPLPPIMSYAAWMSVRPIFSESAWLTCVSRLAGLTPESRENTLMPAFLAFVRTGCSASLSFPTMQIAATFWEMSCSSDLDLRLGGRLIGGAQDGLEALLLDAGLEAAHLLVAVRVARVLEHDGVLGAGRCRAFSPPPDANAGSAMAMIARTMTAVMMTFRIDSSSYGLLSPGCSAEVIDFTAEGTAR